MKLSITLPSLTLLLLGVSPPIANGQTQESVRPPNVVFFLVDDLGWADISPNNPETFYETPHIQSLADSGMRFTSAYAACPVCSPTRASILSGRYPARMHTTDYFGAPQPERILAAGKDGKRGRFQRLPLLPAAYVDHLPLSEATLAETLKQEGYATYFAGKWHLGGDNFLPTDQGFDVNVGGQRRGGPYGQGSYLHPFPEWMPNLSSAEG
ncbi:MAG: arylsulfatase A-like enzyme, partial [Candidatus Paceibacteria bacterium]